MIISYLTEKTNTPFDLIGEEVDIRLTKAMVKVLFYGSKIVSHKMKSRQLRNSVTQLKHMPMGHRKYLNYYTDEFTRRAQSLGQFTANVVGCFLFAGTEPEQGYKSCESLTYMTW